MIAITVSPIYSYRAIVTTLNQKCYNSTELS